MRGHFDVVNVNTDMIEHTEHMEMCSECRGAMEGKLREAGHDLIKSETKLEMNNVPILRLAAAVLVARHQFPPAERRFRRIEELSEKPLLPVLLEWANMRMKWGLKMEEAEAMLALAREIQPQNIKPVILLAKLAIRKLEVVGERVNIPSDYQRGIERAQELFGQALRLDQDSISARLEFSRLLSSRGWLKQAEETLTGALEAQPDNPEILTELGRIYAKQAKSVKSADCFHRALSIEDDNLSAIFGLIGLATTELRFTEGEDLLGRAEKVLYSRNVSTAKLEVIRCSIAVEREEINELDPVLAKLKRLAGNYDPEVRGIAGTLILKVLLRKGLYEEGKNVFLQVSQLNISPILINNFASFISSAAEAKFDASLFQAADQWFQQSLALDSKNAFTLLGYGQNLIKWTKMEPSPDRQERGQDAVRESLTLLG